MEPDFTVLGLDPSLTNFGWGLHRPKAEGAARVVARGRFQTRASTLYVSRYTSLRENLRSVVRDLGPSKVGIEFPVFGSLYSEGMYGLFLFCSEALHAENCDVVFWSPMQIKAHARESLGRPPKWDMMKADMVEAAKADTGGGGVWNHNEADAYLAGRLAARFWLLHGGQIGESDLTPVERKYFLEIKRFSRGKRAGKVKNKGVMYREDERFFLWSQGDGDGEEGNGSSPGSEQVEGAG